MTGCETMLRPLRRRGDFVGLRRHLDRCDPRLARLAAQAAKGAEEWWRVTKGAVVTNKVGWLVVAVVVVVVVVMVVGRGAEQEAAVTARNVCAAVASSTTHSSSLD